MAAAYLTSAQAQTILTGFGLDGSGISDVLLKLASDDLDERRVYIGERYLEDQLRQFPRSITVSDDTAGQVPERILQWVALHAYELTQEDEAPVKSERISKISTTFARGNRSIVSRLKRHLLRPYTYAGVPIV